MGLKGGGGLWKVVDDCGGRERVIEGKGGL